MFSCRCSDNGNFFALIMEEMIFSMYVPICSIVSKCENWVPSNCKRSMTNKSRICCYWVLFKLFICVKSMFMFFSKGSIFVCL
jgi:hypothetical protein